MSTPTQTHLDDPDPENDSETCCKSCGDEYALREGCDPTKYCDQCAHKIVERVELELDQLRAAGNELVASIQETGNTVRQQNAVANWKKEINNP